MGATKLPTARHRHRPGEQSAERKPTEASEFWLKLFKSHHEAQKQQCDLAGLWGNTLNHIQSMYGVLMHFGITK